MEKPLIPVIVSLEEATHVYSDEMGQIYDSWSSRIKQFQEPFNDMIRSKQSAKKHLQETLQRIPTEAEVEKQARVFLRSWKENNKESTDYGTMIHRLCEEYSVYGVIDEAIFDDCPFVLTEEQKEKIREAIPDMASKYLTGFRKTYNEQIIYSLRRKNAGTCDFVGMRVGGKSPILDLKDFKTNKSKGIEHYSKYGNRLFAPLDGLEDCNFNTYALQLSDYAFMLEEEHGFRIGSLAIIYFPFGDPRQHRELYVPYMREEVRMMNDKLLADKTKPREIVEYKSALQKSSVFPTSIEEGEDW